MIKITSEMLLNAFGNERVPFCRDLFMYSLKSLIERGEYGKDITAITQYELQCDPQKYVDNWMNSTIANKEAEEYFKGEDDMNKYETLLKKYQALYKDFEAYREVTEGIAVKGTYVTNEALAELLECKKKYDTLFKEHKAYCYSSEDVAMKLIETEKKYEELKKENTALVDKCCYLNEMIKRRDIKDKQMTDLIKERDNLAKRLEHINAMSNLEWEFEVVEETETQPTTPYDELVSFCDGYEGSCPKCPNFTACHGINMGYKPARWNEDEIAEYNELMNMKEDK
ncbi:MAG: hypothetical protein MJ126_10810 [Lachnospiraceae bacterium]|nr:hypothetical protein [Lachnospiraceae bacterium]